MERQAYTTPRQEKELGITQLLFFLREGHNTASNNSALCSQCLFLSHTLDCCACSSGFHQEDVHKAAAWKSNTRPHVSLWSVNICTSLSIYGRFLYNNRVCEYMYVYKHTVSRNYYNISLKSRFPEAVVSVKTYLQSSSSLLQLSVLQFVMSKVWTVVKLES